MARKQISPGGFCLLAGVFAGASAMLVSFAADARPHHPHGAHASHVVPASTTALVLKRDAASGARRPQDRDAVKTDGFQPNAFIGAETGKGGKQPGGDSKETRPGVPAKEANAPDFHPQDLGPIDTRITVQPRLHGAGSVTVRQTKSKIGPIGSRYSPVWHAFTPGKSGYITRNAIGLPVAPRSVVPANSAALVRSKDAAPNSPTASNDATKLNPGPDHLAVSHPGFQVIGLGAGRPALNGSGFVRRGFVAATLGGPAKNVAVGINGATIRPKH